MRLTVEPDVIALSPGDVVDLVVRVANDGDEVCTPYLEARGIDPSDVVLPAEVVAVAPGEVMTAIVRVRAAADATPGDQRIALAAADLDGQQRPVSATTLLRVGARPDVAVQVEPVATAGRTSARATTILRNRSDRRLQIDLESSAEGVGVRFRPSRVTLDPGETRRVRTRIRRSYRSWFAEIRHGAVVTARGIGAPASTTLTFTQKPAIPRLAVRGLAAFMALAVWIAATVVVFQRINAEDPVADGGTTVVAPAPPGPGRTSATGMFIEEEPDGVRLPIVIQGTIEGPRDLAGTVVTAERISFGDQGTTTGLTKVVALTPVKLPRGAVLDKVQVTTDERGRFRIASGLVADSFYRVTAVRAGFEVGSFIVSTAEDEPEVTLAFALVPAPGVMEGRVVDADGEPIGGATVLVTDGTLTYTTTTASEGLEAGTWTIEGVATPSTYQVVVTRLGFASETLIVEVEGGQRRRGVDATLLADLGTLRGTVSAVDPVSGQTAGVGGIDITLAGPEARTTRTVTAPANLRGGFTFPALPYGTYELTFSAPGWSTRVTEVSVDRGDVVLNVSDLVRSSGVIQGHVWQVATGVDADAMDVSQCRYPRLAQRDLPSTIGRPCGGVSISVTDEDGNLFATASANATGFFQVDGVPAGEYTIRLSRAGYVDHIERRVLTPGGLVDLTPDHSDASPDPIVLELSPALAACLGTVELTVVQRSTGLPVVVGDAIPPSAPGTEIVLGVDTSGIRFPVRSDGRLQDYDFTCGDGQGQPQWRRLEGSNVYRIDNVPLGQIPLVVAFDGFAPTETTLAVRSGDVAKAVVQIATQPRDITGIVRIVSNGAGAAREGLRIRLLDSGGEPVDGKSVTVDVTAPVAGGHTEAEFTIPRVDVDERYSLAFDRPVDDGEFAGVVAAQTTTFTLPAGGEPFVIERQELVARTLVTGTVRGFAIEGSALVASDLADATVTFAPQGGGAPTLATVTGATFVADVPAGRYDVTVAASGYGTRTFSSAALIGTSAADPTQLLQPGTAPYVAYPTIEGKAGEVGLIPTPRAVQVDVTLAGAAGASRDARVELVDGTIAGVATTTPTHAQAGAITVGQPTVSGRFTFAGVPAGVYTLKVVPTDTAGAGGSAIGVQHTAQTVVVGPDGSVARLDVTTTAQAMSRITGRVVGFDVFTLTLEPLEDATVTPLAGAGAAVSTGETGAFDLLVRSGTYGSGQDFPAITVAPPAGAGYETRSVTGSIGALTGGLPGVSGAGGLFLVYPGLAGGVGGDVGLDPDLRSIEVVVDLRGVLGSTTRDLVVRLIEGEVRLDATAQSLVDVDLVAATSSTVTAGTPKTFASGSVRPGTYVLDIAVATGTRVVLDGLASGDETTARVRPGSGADAGKWFVDIQPGASTIGLTATVQARTVLTGTVYGFDATLEPATISGATIAVPASARATAPGVGVPAAETVTVVSDVDGKFTIEVDAGEYDMGADFITAVGPNHQQRTFRPVLAGPTGTLLTGAASPDDRSFLANAALAGVEAEDGDVVLTPTPRTVTVDLTLLGASGAQRDVKVELTGGTLGGVATSPASVVVASTTLTVGAASPATVTLPDVPVGAFTLTVQGVAADHVTTRSESVTVAPASGFFAVGGRDVQALTTLTVNVTGVQVGAGQSLTLDSAPLAGASVTVPAAGGLGEVTGATVAPSGAVTLVVASGTYGSGGTSGISVAKAGYVTADVATTTLVDPTGSVTSKLEPADTTFSGTIVLDGATGASRTVVVDVCPAADCETPSLTLSGIELSTGSNVFDSGISTLPVGVYTFRITGNDVETTTVTRVIGPVAGAYPVTTISARATVTVTGTVVEGATTGDPVAASPSRSLDATLALGGVTVTPAAAGVPAGAPATVGTDATGAFSLTLLSGASVALSFARTDFTLAAQNVSVGAAPKQGAGTFTMLRGAAGIRIEGAISNNVKRVVVRPVGSTVAEEATTVLPTGALGARRYSFEGLATGVNWEIEFVVGSAESERFVRRYVTSDDPLAIDLDQDASDARIGDLVVTVEIADRPAGTGDVPSWVRIELIETVPSAFYSIPGGSVTVWKQRTGSASSGLYTVSHTFAQLQDAASSRSLPTDRFRVVVTLVEGDDNNTAWNATRYRAATGSGWTAEADAPEATALSLDPGDTVATLRFETVPGAPTARSAVAVPQAGSSQQINVSWDAPSLTGGATSALQYVVAYRTGGGAFSSVDVGSNTEAQLIGLTAGAAYEIQVRARNTTLGAGPLGEGAPATTSATTASVPAAPTISSIVSDSDSELTVAFTPGGDGGSAITNYEYSIDNGATWTARTPAATTSPLVITGLTNDTNYEVRIRAVNAVGSSPGSNMVVPPPLLTGGTITTFTDTDGTEYRVHTFASVGTFTLGVVRSGPVEFLVVGGGGGGGNAYDGGPGGGGGAGGFRQGTVLVGPASLSVTVGAGGAGGAAEISQTPGSPGGASSLGDISAAGGGAGGGSRGNGGDGGSGGGAGGRPGFADTTRLGGAGNVPATTPPQGNKGGDNVGSNADGAKGGGGGGGAGGPGGSSGTRDGGAAGTGISSTFAGRSAVTYASGGAGGSSDTTGAGAAATVFGGGGGGASAGDSTPWAGGSGQGGIVIVRYRVAASGS